MKNTIEISHGLPSIERSIVSNDNQTKRICLCVLNRNKSCRLRCHKVVFFRIKLFLFLAQRVCDIDVETDEDYDILSIRTNTFVQI